MKLCYRCVIIGFFIDEIGLNNVKSNIGIDKTVKRNYNYSDIQKQVNQLLERKILTNCATLDEFLVYLQEIKMRNVNKIEKSSRLKDK
jgi:hypothetical protein